MTKNDKIIAYTIGVIMLMELIDGSALNTALPQIANSLDVNAISLKVAITVYLLTLGLFIPAAGWLSDKIGGQKLLIFSIVGFVISSVACGLSTNLITLVIFRALQGVFGAFTMPVARLTMVKIFKNNVLDAMSIIAVIGTLGPMIGPLFGGVITTYISWRVIFFINVPIGILSLILIYKYLPNIIASKINKFDLKGFILIGSSIALFMFFVDLLVDYSINYNIKFIFLILACIFFTCYIFHSRKKENPVINLNVFKNKAFKYFSIISSFSRLFMVGMTFIFPLYLQTKQSYTAFESGLSLMAFVIPAWYIKKFVKRLLKKLHFFKFFIFNLGLMICGFIYINVIFIHFNILLFILGLIVLGANFSMFTMVTNAGMYNSFKESKNINDVAIINSTIIQLAGAFSISAIGIILANISNIKILTSKSIILTSAFSDTLLICALGLSLIICYIIFCKPKNLKSIPII